MTKRSSWGADIASEMLTDPDRSRTLTTIGCRPGGNMKSPSLKATKPLSFLDRKVSLDGKALFTSISKALLNLATARPVEALAEVPELLAAVGLAETDENLTWALILRGYQRALCQLLHQKFQAEPDPIAAIKGMTWDSLDLDHVQLEVTEDFFKAPSRSAVVLQLVDVAKRWLETSGLSQADAANISNRITGYFALGVHNEWRSDPNRYNPILERLNSPFLPAVKREIEWSRYRATLAEMIDASVFEETFSLRQIYIPGRAYYFAESGKKSRADGLVSESMFESSQARVQRVVWLAEEINSWINKRDIKSSIRLVSGGPGSGKSSFAKMLSAASSEREDLCVLFVPLHLIDLDKGLSRAIGDYFAAAEYFSNNPIDDSCEAKPLLLILDGLDELQMQGKAAQLVAEQLVRDADRLVTTMNMNGCRIQCIITGRELSVQSAEAIFKEEGEVLHLIPYYEPSRQSAIWSDPDKLLSIDQRNDWWSCYGNLVGASYDGIPGQLTQGELGDVTAQPLLNYLVALSYKRGGIALDESTNINSVYADLLSAVYERGWARNPHPAVQGIAQDDFVRLLEEVALSVWHGAGRTATLKEVEDHCKESSIGGLLPSFEEGAAAGVSNLLLAFYFRQKGMREGGDRSFEFTHKTFAEYLIALRVVRAFYQIAQKFLANEKDPEEGWDYKECLYRWARICSKTRIDVYTVAFIRREIVIRGSGFARTLQSAGSALLGHSLAHGWPMQRFNALSFHQQCQGARNSEEALLACLNAAARQTQELSQVKWPSRVAAGEMVKRLQGQRTGPTNEVSMDCLSHLNLNHCFFDIADLYGANLSHSNLRFAALHYTILTESNLSGADLRDAVFMGAVLDGARLEGAKFSSSVGEKENRGAIYLGADPRNTPARQQRLRTALLDRQAVLED